MPRLGHLEKALYIMSYLKLRHNPRFVFDSSYTNTDHSSFWEGDWTYFYGSAMKAMPPNAPPPSGKKVVVCMFLDSNHAGTNSAR